MTERLNSLGVWERDSDWPFSNRIYNYATVSRHFDDYNRNYVLIIGGLTGEAHQETQSDKIVQFMNGMSKWSIVGHLQQRRHSHSVLDIDQTQILVVGGNDLR